MATYPPDTQPSGTFNINYWASLNYAQTTNGSTTGFLTEQIANGLYLQLATGGIVQGSSTFPSLAATTNLTTPLIISNGDLSITTPDGNTLSITSGKTSGDININTGTTNSNINIQAGDLNLENGTLDIANGNISVGAPNSTISLNGQMTASSFVINGSGSYTGNAVTSESGADLLVTASIGQNITMNTNRAGQGIYIIKVEIQAMLFRLVPEI
jgi:hypothetical protein